MNGNAIVHFRMDSLRPRERRYFDVVASRSKFVGKHLHMKIPSTHQRRRVTIGRLQNAH
jgi:hypothetical protein